MSTDLDLEFAHRLFSKSINGERVDEDRLKTGITNEYFFG